MKKVLIVATVVKKHIMQFHVPTLEMFKSSGWETHVAGGNDYAVPSDCCIPHCDVYHEVDFARFPFHPKNIKAYLRLKKIIKEGNFDLIHCHTPVGGILTRLAACKARKAGTKVFYTAHGFHFFKGAPVINRLLYYPAEWLCSFMTDVLLTINEEDYKLAKTLFHAKATCSIAGVGVDTERMSNAFCCRLREEIGAEKDSILLLSIGEVRKLKNHKTIIRAMKKLDDKRIHYVIAGEGEEKEKLIAMAESLGLKENVHLLGYRTDVSSLIKECDIFCFPSYREGLPVALMEAMAGALPIVASRIRGNVDLIDEGKGGFLYHPEDSDGFAKGIKTLIENPCLREQMQKYNLAKIKGYDVSAVCAQLKEIYKENGVAL